MKALYLRILRRLARLNVHQLNLLLQTPGHKMPARQLRAVVTANRLRLASQHHDLVQYPRHPSTSKAGVYFQCQTFSRKRVHYTQHPDRSPCRQHIMHKI